MLERCSAAQRYKPVYNNKMYAIVEINGQQFKAEEGKKIFVNHIKDAEE
ncbi:MAG: bL21 family ribosomal protein, partial [Prevotella denticola]